ncbi:MAG: metallophosphoesterase [Nitrospinae bacterium]|nr:metallophosphoesterase [Nitrospinota bacterium]
MTGLRFLLFFIAFTSVLFGMHLFVYLRVAQGLALGPREASLLKWLLLIGGLSFYAGMFYRRWPELYQLLYVGQIWMGFISIAFAFLVVKLGFDTALPAHTRGITLITLLSIAFATGYSLWNAHGQPRLKEVRVDGVKGAPPGFTIVQISDLHLWRLGNVEWLEGVSAAANAQNPDIIVITGDVMDDTAEALKEYLPPLQKLKAKYGVYAVAGNHDHYAGLQNFYDLMAAAGIHVLRNQKADIGGVIELLGVDDEDLDLMRGFDAFLKERITPGGKPVIVLKHRPTEYGHVEKAGAALMLAGHSHAGQIPPLDLIVALYYRHPYGLYKENGTWFYTTCGTGTWGPPMRLFSRSEIVKLTLR